VLSGKPAVAAAQSAAQAARAGEIAEQRDLGIENEGQLVVVPHRVQFGEIGDIEAALLQAGVVEDRFQPEDDRIDVPMHLIEGRGRGAVLAVARTARRIEPGIEFESAEAGQAERAAHHIDPPHRLPETHLETDPQLRGAGAKRRAAGIRRVFLSHGEQIEAAKADRQHAAPADIGDRIGEAAGAGWRRQG
jgi:hypothetical protein